MSFTAWNRDERESFDLGIMARAELKELRERTRDIQGLKITQRPIQRGAVGYSHVTATITAVSHARVTSRLQELRAVQDAMTAERRARWQEKYGDLGG